jgi:hypothetical protein
MPAERLTAIQSDGRVQWWETDDSGAVTRHGVASPTAVWDARNTLHVLRLQALWAEERSPLPPWVVTLDGVDACGPCCRVTTWGLRTLASGRRQVKCLSCGDTLTDLPARELYTKEPRRYPCG